MSDVRPFEEYKEMIKDMRKEEMIKGLYDLSGRITEQDKVIQELLERIANLERNIEEAREFLVHSSINIEDMERVDEIFGS